VSSRVKEIARIIGVEMLTQTGREDAAETVVPFFDLGLAESQT
jgi:hypothetical protein